MKFKVFTTINIISWLETSLQPKIFTDLYEIIKSILVDRISSISYTNKSYLVSQLTYTFYSPIMIIYSNNYTQNIGYYI